MPKIILRIQFTLLGIIVIVLKKAIRVRKGEPFWHELLKVANKERGDVLSRVDNQSGDYPSIQEGNQFYTNLQFFVRETSHADRLIIEMFGVISSDWNRRRDD